jgi:hypothetical protein
MFAPSSAPRRGSQRRETPPRRRGFVAKIPRSRVTQLGHAVMSAAVLLRGPPSQRLHQDRRVSGKIGRSEDLRTLRRTRAEDPTGPPCRGAFFGSAAATSQPAASPACQRLPKLSAPVLPASTSAAMS